MRTGGNVNGFMDLKLKQLIEQGQQPGPAIDATAPYLNGPNTFLQMRDMKDADEARKHVAYWADMGATSFKAYMQIIARAAARGRGGGAQARAEDHRPPLFGDLRRSRRSSASTISSTGSSRRPTSSPTSSRTPVPGQGGGQRTIAALDENGEPFKALVKKLSTGRSR